MSEVVVVTGASAGVGRAVAREFARHGASVGLLARGPEGLDVARREVEAAGGRALAVPTDVADHEQVEAATQAVEDGRFRFESASEWLYDVAWDLGLAAVTAEGCRLGVLAATDTD